MDMNSGHSMLSLQSRWANSYNYKAVPKMLARYDYGCSGMTVQIRRESTAPSSGDEDNN